MTTESIPMLLHCPLCNKRHIDEGEFATKPHHTHSCQHCGHTWRPAIVATVGVQFLPGFKNEPKYVRDCKLIFNGCSSPLVCERFSYCIQRTFND